MWLFPSTTASKNLAQMATAITMIQTLNMEVCGILRLNWNDNLNVIHIGMISERHKFRHFSIHDNASLSSPDTLNYMYPIQFNSIYRFIIQCSHWDLKMPTILICTARAVGDRKQTIQFNSIYCFNSMIYRALMLNFRVPSIWQRYKMFWIVSSHWIKVNKKIW